MHINLINLHRINWWVSNKNLLKILSTKRLQEPIYYFLLQQIPDFQGNLSVKTRRRFIFDLHMHWKGKRLLHAECPSACWHISFGYPCV